MIEKLNMDQKMLYRACALYEFDQGHSAAEAGRNIRNTYGSDAISDSSCRRWFARFKSGDRTLEDREREGRPEIVDRRLLKEAVDANPFLSTRDLENMFDCSLGTISNALNEIGKVKKLGRWVPHKLSQKNTFQRLITCSSLLSMAKKSSFWTSILTSDEKWIMLDNSSRKSQWLDKKQPPLPTPKPNPHGKKVMLCVWWNTRGVVHHEVLEKGETVDSQLYCQQLERVNRKLIRNGENPRKIRLLHDNARPHVSNMTQSKIEELGWKVLPHAPYSPDLAPTDYHLFRSMQHKLRNEQFKNVEEVKKWVEDYFASQPAEFFHSGITKLRERWRKTIDVNGEYFID